MFFLVFALISKFLSQEDTSKPYFFEPFEEDSIGSRWIVSEDPYYNGTWAIEDRVIDFVEEGRKGLTMTTAKTFNGISCKAPFTADGKELVIQYEVKVQEQPVDCGGAYIKLISQDFEPRSFGDKTNFTIMFGPDKCGSKNKVQYIQRIQNPITKQWAEHALVNPPTPSWDNMTHLYRLRLTEDQRFEISIDGKVESSGSLHEEGLFEPPFEPPKTVPDYSVKKPEDWVDAAEIPDVNDTKPADWDDDAPMEIRDPNATKPADWDENMPLYIPDPEAKKPDYWNDEEDGVYEVPQIENPECENHGCGPWEPPMIPNPAYKGKWTPRMIPNPAYKGVWKPPQIPNKNHFTPENLHILGQVYGIAIDVLALTPHVLFDNIYVGHSLEQAQEYANDTWVPRHEAEEKAKKEFEAAEKREMRTKAIDQIKQEPTLKGKAGLIKDLALDLYEDNRMLGTVVVFFALGSIIVPIVFCCRCCCGPKEEAVSEGQTEAEKKKKEEEDKKEIIKKEEEDQKKKDEEGEEGEKKTEEKPAEEDQPDAAKPKQKKSKKAKKEEAVEEAAPAEAEIKDEPKKEEEKHEDTPVKQRAASSSASRGTPRKSKKSQKPARDD